MTGKPSSTLASAADINLDISVTEEACPLGLAPTSSTTASLVMGDALAIALLDTRGFTAEDFAMAHPGGRLGRRLLLRIADVMRKGKAIPQVSPHASVKEALIEMSEKQLGFTTVIDHNNHWLGIFTDGDLRRVLTQNLDIQTTLITQVMTHEVKSVHPETLVTTALTLLEKHKITALLVQSDSNTLLGVVHLHDLLQAGVL